MKFLHRNFDSTNADSDKDRQGCRKRGMVDAEMPDSHVWGSKECLPNFVVIEVPQITDKSECPGGPSGMRKVWRDDFGYRIDATRPAQGEFDIAVFEQVSGGQNQNHVTAAKATRVQNYLLAWGCSGFSLASYEGRFTFSLWNAVRSSNFWNVTPVKLAGINFTLNSYSGVSGIGNITATINQEAWGPYLKSDPSDPTGETKIPMTQIEIENQISQFVTRKVTERGGLVMVNAFPNYTFEIERSDLLTKFRADVKRRIEQVYMYQQHRLNDAWMEAAVAAGGTLAMTKADYLAAIRDMAIE